jgi:hypothetical protein
LLGKISAALEKSSRQLHRPHKFSGFEFDKALVVLACQKSFRMPLFILAETSAGYALLKAKDKKLLQRDDLGKEFETAEGTSNL